MKIFTNDENRYSIYKNDNDVIGYCNIYLNAQVKFAVQMRPNLTSQGNGKEFMKAVLSFVKEKYNLKSIGLLVLKFNDI